MHFYKMFDNVAHWSLDLSNNKLSTLESNTFYENGTNWRLKGTSMLKGMHISRMIFKGKYVCKFSIDFILHCIA